jgi:hypothetical protein
MEQLTGPIDIARERRIQQLFMVTEFILRPVTDSYCERSISLCLIKHSRPKLQQPSTATRRHKRSMKLSVLDFPSCLIQRFRAALRNLR